jgi:hypothetical protein
MPKYLKQMTEEERAKGLLFLETTMVALQKVTDSTQATAEQVERAYQLLAEAVIAKARITSMKGVNHD